MRPRDRPEARRRFGSFMNLYNSKKPGKKSRNVSPASDPVAGRDRRSAPSHESPPLLSPRPLRILVCSQPSEIPQNAEIKISKYCNRLQAADPMDPEERNSPRPPAPPAPVASPSRRPVAAPTGFGHPRAERSGRRRLRGVARRQARAPNHTPIFLIYSISSHLSRQIFFFTELFG